MLNNIYECNLYSITPDIRVNHDWSKERNILRANKMNVKKIMVSPTFKRNFYREIITGVQIPVYRIHTLQSLCKVYYSIPSLFLSYYIMIIENGLLFQYYNNLEIATTENLKEYLEKYSSNPAALKKELNEIFQKAEEYYECAYKKGEYSDEYKVKCLLKTIRRR